MSIDTATRIPIDNTARIVVSDNRDQEREFRCGDVICSMVPLPMAPFVGPRKDDLTGRKCGRFTVIGCALYRAPGRNNTVRWVVKCHCGRYQLLTSKSVKKNHPSTMCVECQKNVYVAKAKMNQSYDLQRMSGV
jgi:hypothetical protein